MSQPDPLSSNRRTIAWLLGGVFAIALTVQVTSLVMTHWGMDSAGPTVTASGSPRVERVLIISIDGLRPDVLLRARAPRIRGLMERGAFSMWARTTEMSITLPSHTSMLTGVRPDIHRVVWNRYIENVYPDVPTIFEQAHKVWLSQDQRLTTGMVAGKGKFHEIAKPGTIDYIDVYQDKEGSNVEVGEVAANMIRRHAPRVMFVHIPDVDVVGHAVGWGTYQQLRAVETADAAVGMMLDALSDKGLLGAALIILSADHGGQGKTHGPNDPRSRHIPWIVVGPGVRRNYDLTRLDKLVINTEDTFATACAMMHLPVPDHIDGRFVEEILEPGPQTELMYTVSEDDRKKPEPYDHWWQPPSYNWERTPIPPHHN
ncbi:MAG TPA: alkaline phosphatase family protein [Tepidisphaeraceae bacterium]|jgi:hypothetical protein